MCKLSGFTIGVSVLLTALAASTPATAGDLHIPLPGRNTSTPVQRLNREGVEAIRKNKLEKARALFYKAYLFDPNDPFTLNNLGYVSELEGSVDRAEHFYSLAAQVPTDAVIDQASSRKVEGQTVAEVSGSVEDKAMQVNRDNVAAIRMLSQGRAPEADLLLQSALRMDPGNPFTMNNYAVAKEMEGDYEGAEKYYLAAAKSKSSEPIIVTLNTAWRGKPVSEMAAWNAKAVRDRIEHENSLEARVRRLNLQGVCALNRNDRYDARKYFEDAYKLDPNNPFVLNNRGYLAEMDGDRESAQFFYEKARQSPMANLPVGYATLQSAEGQKLFQVAGDNNQKMEAKLAERQAVRRRNTGPVVLMRRDNTPVTAPEQQPPVQEQTPHLGPPQPPVPGLTPDHQP
jgi:Flp pilus assembly protein TadD